MRMTIPRIAAAVMMSLAAAVGSVVGAAPASAAASGWVYVSFPTWLGNCPNGGTVNRIYAAIGNTWATSSTGDNGDDLIYGKVNLNTTQQISWSVYCSGLGRYSPLSSAQSIRPSRNNQTVWVGPAGVRYN